MLIRPAQAADHAAIWGILEPIIRAGETYTLPRDFTRDAALRYWCGEDKSTFVMQNDTEIVGTYYLRANYAGGGAHIANCGFMTAPRAAGQGIGRAMAVHALAQAQGSGFKAMQFNFVVSTNKGAIKLWDSLGFTTLCRLPAAFDHPAFGVIDALVMWKIL